MIFVLFAWLLQSASIAATDGQRFPITDSVAGYTYTVRTGPGPYDVIGLHRVVRESAPGIATPTKSGAFLVHGDVFGFRPLFLAKGAQSFAVHLANQGVDVWGIDFRWTKVPEEVTDLSFMKDWGLELHVQDIKAGLEKARAVRAGTGSGDGKLALLGYSRGGMIGYSYLNAETRVPEALRNVNSFISVDNFFVTDDKGIRNIFNFQLAIYKSLIRTGKFASKDGADFSKRGREWAADPIPKPDDYPAIYRRQLALALGAKSSIGYWPFHHVAGQFNGGVTERLLYTQEADWRDLMLSASPYEPAQLLVDTSVIAASDESNVSLIDDLRKITVPVFYVGAAGGFGDLGSHCSTLMGSSERKSLIIAREQPAQAAVDFGHVDLFLAESARTSVWDPISNWIRSH